MNQKHRMGEAVISRMYTNGVEVLLSLAEKYGGH